MELTDILNDDAAPPAPEPIRESQAERVPSGETETSEARAERLRDEQGRFAPKPQETPDAAPPAVQRQDAGPIPIQALLDERERRQKAERERDELRARATPPPPPPQFPEFRSPQEFAAYMEDRIRHEVQQVRMQSLEERFNSSVSYAQTQYPDYAQAEDAFLQAAQRDPALGKALAAAPDPAAFAYGKGKEFIEAERDRLADDDALFQRMLEKRGQSLSGGVIPPRASPTAFPTSLSTARAAAPRAQPGPSGDPTPLSALGNQALRMS